jgi:hypothetical protein
MQLRHKQIALDFSGGNFEFAYEYLADDVCFNIIGNEIITGKAAVIEFCTKTAKYFTEVTTKFSLDNVIVDNDYLCDVYKFKHGKLQEVNSYCISTKKEES